ncbi:guanylate kinase domain-containing protein [Ditylenchus destructor]|uniref:guanylate kinase n=1 Tax=Ditylenchus destructor TaxID=166010 RepID=A0AAD4NEU3_9BILA|nr:guanylate kinase domain-containing protein [Ditylenchus destructor]
MERYPGKFAFSVSHTTRKPRPGEIDGVHYHFTDMETMRKMIANGEFFEHAEFGGNLYGTSKKAVDVIQEAGKICVLDVELQGVLNFKKSNLPAKYILIKPPSIEVLKTRLKQRGTETPESLQKRLERAKDDLAAIDNIMAKNDGLFDYVIVNDDLNYAYERFINALPLNKLDEKKEAA